MLLTQMSTEYYEKAVENLHFWKPLDSQWISSEWRISKDCKKKQKRCKRTVLMAKHCKTSKLFNT